MADRWPFAGQLPVTPAARLNYLNLACMVGAALLALYLPLPLFLLSYAVLGPAHYLTEIPWLHQRRYFTEQPLAGRALLAAGIAVVLANQLLLSPGPHPAWLSASAMSAAYVLMLGIATAVLVRLSWQRAALFLLLLLATISFSPLYVFVFLFVPTLVHVYGFTGAFLLGGTLRDPRPSAWVACGAFVLCPLALVLVLPAHVGWAPPTTHQAYAAFLPLTRGLAELLPAATPAQALVLATRLIAWAYCYHYLNWFTKTRRIGFLGGGRRQLLAIGLLWAGSVGLYVYDYAAGLRWLYCLSLLHVLLELPLNRLSFVTIARHLSRDTLAPPAVAGRPGNLPHK